MSRKRDALDLSLIALLQEDGRISTSEIARRLGLARSTVNERITRLEQDGTIAGYCAIVQSEEPDSETRAFLRLGCDRARRGDIVKALRGYPEIVECFSISGQYDLMFVVVAPCAEDIDALIDEVAQISGVKDLETTLVLAAKFSHATVGRPRSRPVLALAQ